MRSDAHDGLKADGFVRCGRIRILYEPRGGERAIKQGVGRVMNGDSN